MPPKGILKKGKRARFDKGSSSQSPPEPEYVIRSLANPKWPREENTPFLIEFESEDKTLKEVLQDTLVDDREILNKWDDFNSLLYNEWLKVTMAPTRYAHRLTMGCLHIRDEVEELLQKVGLDKLATHDEGLYPDLVRQFFASVKLYSEAETEEQKLDPSCYILSFMASGKRLEISARGICRVFGFPVVPVAGLPEDIAGGVHTLWSHIGAGSFQVGSSSHTDIRHPVLRYLVRLFSTTILCKMEPGKVRKHELVLLSYALRDLIPNETWSTGFQPNMAVVFMDHLYSLRHTPLSATHFGKRLFTVGNMLTPIFQQCKVPLPGYYFDKSDGFVDLDHMKRAHWTKGEYPIHWVFPLAVGGSRMVTIPSVVDWMPVTTDASLLSFTPREDLLMPIETTRKLKTRGVGTPGASTSQAPPQTHSEALSHQHEFPPSLQDQASVDQKLDWIARALQAVWDALSCQSSCVRPRTPSPPRPAPPATSPEDASDFQSAEDEA